MTKVADETTRAATERLAIGGEEGVRDVDLDVIDPAAGECGALDVLNERREEESLDRRAEKRTAPDVGEGRIELECDKAEGRPADAPRVGDALDKTGDEDSLNERLRKPKRGEADHRKLATAMNNKAPQEDARGLPRRPNNHNVAPKGVGDVVKLRVEVRHLLIGRNFLWGVCLQELPPICSNPTTKNGMETEMYGAAVIRIFSAFFGPLSGTDSHFPNALQ
jgi:hypothetical protein